MTDYDREIDAPWFCADWRDQHPEFPLAPDTAAASRAVITKEEPS